MKPKVIAYKVRQLIAPAFETNDWRIGFKLHEYGSPIKLHMLARIVRNGVTGRDFIECEWKLETATHTYAIHPDDVCPFPGYRSFYELRRLNGVFVDSGVKWRDCESAYFANMMAACFSLGGRENVMRKLSEELRCSLKSAEKLRRALKANPKLLYDVYGAVSPVMKHQAQDAYSYLVESKKTARNIDCTKYDQIWLRKLGIA